MAQIPESSNQEIPFHMDPCNCPCFGNVGPPMMATLSLPGLTIGLPVWLFSIPNVPNAPNTSPIRSTCPRHHTDTHPLHSTHAKSFSPSSSLSGESSITSNQESNKKKKKANRKKTPNQDNKPPASGHHAGGHPLASGHHAGGQPLAPDHHADGKSLTPGHHVEDNPLASLSQAGGQRSTIVGPSDNNHHVVEKPTRIGRKPKYPCRLCKGDHFLLDCPGISKVLEVWSQYSDQPMASTSGHHVDDKPLTRDNTVEGKKGRVKFPCQLCGRTHHTHICPHMDEASYFLENIIVI